MCESRAVAMRCRRLLAASGSRLTALVRLVVDSAVDRRHFLRPSPTIGVLQREDVVERPMQVIRDVGYLLVEPLKGVAYDSPAGKKSTSNVLSHFGQVTVIFDVPGSLIR